MTPVRMIHPLHGATHAYDQGEIDRLKGYGWEPEEVFDKEIAAKAWHQAHVEAMAAVEEKVAKRKPGRPRKG